MRLPRPYLFACMAVSAVAGVYFFSQKQYDYQIMMFLLFFAFVVLIVIESSKNEAPAQLDRIESKLDTLLQEKDK